MKQLEGFAFAIVLIIALVYWDRIPKPIWFLALFAVLKVWSTGVVDNAVHNEKEKIRLEGRLLPKASANPLYNVVPIPM